MNFIPFNKVPFVGKEPQYVLEAIKSNKISGDGPFTQKCEDWFKNTLGCTRALLTSSCTHALEMCALLINIKPGDEVILPSYTFVSTANAFVLRGATAVFVDICPNTMNIDETKIEEAITPRTKAIVVVHYAGVVCNMDAILRIAEKHNLYVIEDAAQAMLSTYKNKYAGTIGHLGTFSFHESKNYTSAGEGGLLIINDSSFIERAEILREKGTNRSKFFRGEIDKYTWVDVGSSYLMNDVSAAYLWGQLENANNILQHRMTAWELYYRLLSPLKEKNLIELPHIPSECTHNAHMFYIKTRNLDERTRLMDFLKQHGIYAVFHYVPLHSSPAGITFGRFHGEDIYTTKESERLLRLPLFYGITQEEVEYIANKVKEFYHCANQ